MDYSTTDSSLAPAGADQGRAGALAREQTPRMNKVQLNARSLGRIGNRRAAPAYTLTDFPAMLFARPYAHPAPASQTRAAGARTRPRTLRHPASLRPSHYIRVVSFVACDSPSRTPGGRPASVATSCSKHDVIPSEIPNPSLETLLFWQRRARGATVRGRPLLGSA